MPTSSRKSHMLFNGIGDHEDMRLCGSLSAISAGAETLHSFTLENHLHSTALACGTDGCEGRAESAGGFPRMACQQRWLQLDLVRSPVVEPDLSLAPYGWRKYLWHLLEMAKTHIHTDRQQKASYTTCLRAFLFPRCHALPTE